MEIVVPDDFKHLYVQNVERPVVKIPDPVLRKVAAPVERIDKKIDEFISTMVNSMKAANGVGLAAPQLGKSLRIIVIAPAGSKPMVLINPVITAMEGEAIGEEGCLSIPGLYGDVKRAHKVTVEANDRRGKPMAYEMEGMAARIVQHEVDHLEGILFIDKVDVSTLHWMDPDNPDSYE